MTDMILLGDRVRWQGLRRASHRSHHNAAAEVEALTVRVVSGPPEVVTERETFRASGRASARAALSGWAMRGDQFGDLDPGGGGDVGESVADGGCVARHVSRVHDHGCFGFACEVGVDHPRED